MLPHTVAVVGLGLIGTSVGMAARRAWPGVNLVGLDRADVLLHPHVAATFDRLSTDHGVLAGADLVVLALPVRAIISELPRLAAVPGPRAVITDTGSTKRAVIEAAVGLAPFVGGHPMAGAERGGPELARADLFDGRTWWVVPGDATATATLRAFAGGLGARPVEIDAARHDALMAATSHLPQVVASALMARVGVAVGEEGLAHAGAGLRDTTRLADSPADTWVSVLGTNADLVAPLLGELAGDLQRIAAELEDAPAVQRLFADARHWRAALPK